MRPSRSILASFFFLVLLAGLTAGFIQEIIFHEKIDESGNHLLFRSSLPDTTAIAQLGPISKICCRGIWRIYAEKNFMSYTRWLGSPLKSGKLICYDGAMEFQSVRRHVASESEQVALSLYRNKAVSGPEILVTEEVLVGIEMPVESYAVSAGRQWTIFEGKYFTGNSACIPDFTDDRYVYAYNARHHNLTTVGSVVKTCDRAKIRSTIDKYNKGA